MRLLNEEDKSQAAHFHIRLLRDLCAFNVAGHERTCVRLYQMMLDFLPSAAAKSVQTPSDRESCDSNVLSKLTIQVLQLSKPFGLRHCLSLSTIYVVLANGNHINVHIFTCCS